jgi:hypothetical protein
MYMLMPGMSVIEKRRTDKAIRNASDNVARQQESTATFCDSGLQNVQGLS